MRVLITNDDGLDAEGLYLLEELALQFTDDVCVVAPLSNQSGVGRAISLHKDIEFVRRDERHYGVSGTPADCVMMALNLLYADKKPDLVLSGINHGMNVADDVGYSARLVRRWRRQLLMCQLLLSHNDSFSARWILHP